MNNDTNLFLPLSPATLHILLALAGGDQHGYGIMKEVARQSEGQYKLGPGTLYDNLQKLMDRGLVKETSRRSQNQDPPPPHYQLTPFGPHGLPPAVVRLKSFLEESKLTLH